MNKKDQVKRIFDDISPRYDFLNHFLSAGIDYYWRRKALKLTGIKSNSRLLDIACGTGDFAITARKMGVSFIVGTDLSYNMLKLFKKKTGWAKGNIVQSVAEHMPLKQESFTNITVAFGVRNFYDIKKGLDSFYRILCNKGKVTILEFRLPSSLVVKKIYSFYFNKVLPAIGRLISRDKEAYTYLPESVHEFDSKIILEDELKNAGFKNITTTSLSLGIVQVVIGEK